MFNLQKIKGGRQGDLESEGRGREDGELGIMSIILAFIKIFLFEAN